MLDAHTGSVVFFTTEATLPAALAERDVHALTRGPLLAAPRFAAAVSRLALETTAA